jgi:Reverse transcriptase (RNA-dependent DNA polymerase)
MKRKHTYHLVLRSDLPNGTKVLPGKWVFLKKVKPGGEIRLFGKQMRYAFLNGTLPKPSMLQPTGLEQGKRCQLVCEVTESLYGLTTAANIWYSTLGGHLKERIQASPYDGGLCIHTTKPNLYLSAHVDDIKIFSADPKNADWVLRTLHERFEIKDLGQMYLGMDIRTDESDIHLSQPTYIHKLLEDFGMQGCHPVRPKRRYAYR